PRWPPHSHGESVPMKPHIYRIRATPARGVASAEPQPIDLREVTAAIIRVTEEPPLQPPSAPTPGPSVAAVADLGVLRDAAGQPGPAVVRAYADEREREVAIELAELDPPYRRWEHAATLEE